MKESKYVVTFIIVAWALIVILLAYSLKQLNCASKGIWMGMPYKYEWPGVCLIEVSETKWFPVENVLYVMPEVP